jgi:hypothetical protein
MRMRFAWMAVLLLAACGQPAPQGSAPSETDSATPPLEAEVTPTLAQVDPSLLAAPAGSFTAVEPSELGVFGAPDVRDALGDLLAGAHESDTGTLTLTVREEGDTAVADVVRSEMPDDSVAAGHVRVEFRREPEGWFPTNAYRRFQCRRGSTPGQWTKELCP